MKRSRYSEEQIVYTLRQAEAGTPVGACAGSAEATFYACEKRYAHLGVIMARNSNRGRWNTGPIAGPTSRELTKGHVINGRQGNTKQKGSRHG